MTPIQPIITLDVSDLSTPIEKNKPSLSRHSFMTGFLPRVQEALNSILDILLTPTKNKPSTGCDTYEESHQLDSGGRKKTS